MISSVNAAETASLRNGTTMKINAIRGCGMAAVLLVSVAVFSSHGQSQLGKSAAAIPAGATRCDLSIPISIGMLPLNSPSAGESARFQVVVESTLDPDVVKRSWIEYSVRRRGMLPRESVEQREGLGRGREDRFEIGVPIADTTRHEIRARYVVELKSGNRIAQTAVRWVDLGDEDAADGLIGRIENPDGTGVRVYRGTTVKN
jgi:hypothetical protein